ncbi:MAG TPA: oligosaccharide flippase family protein [Candidatus Polarisedimenticolia bacterium]|nr:oligosaccharide flippase family protein [Candidatus Polarisedimenticolia bacterium]
MSHVPIGPGPLPSPGADERRAAARGVAWSGVEAAAAALTALLMTPLVLRTCGLEGLGLWGAAWSVAHTAGLIDLGVGSAYGRFAAQALARGDERDLNATLAVGVGFQGAVSLVILGLAALFGPALLDRVLPAGDRPPEAGFVLGATFLTVLLRGTLSAYRGVVAGAQRLDLLARIGTVGTIGEAALAAALLLSGGGLRGPAIAALVGALGVTLAEAAAAHRLCPGLHIYPFRAPREQYARVLVFGGQVQVTRAFEVLGGHAPRLLLAAGPGLAAAGAYEIAARLSGFAQSAASLPLKVLIPLAGHLEVRADTRRLKALLERSTRYVTLLALPVVVALLLLPETVIVAWTARPAPPGTAAAARLVVLAVAALVVVSPLRLLLRASGRAGLEAAATAAGALVQIGAAAALAGRHGAPGVALATCAGAIVALLFVAAGGRRAATLRTGDAARAARAPLIAGLGALAVGIALQMLFPVAAATGRGQAIATLLTHLLLPAAVFLGLAWRGRAAGRDEIGLLFEALRAPSRAAGRAS